MSVAVALSAAPFDARIALKLSATQVLIVGAELASFPKSLLEPLPTTELHAELHPGGDLRLIAPDQVQQLKFESGLALRPDDSWRIYPGGRVVIQQLAIVTYCGGLGGYVAAIATSPVPLPKPDEYLAAPGAGLGVISTPKLSFNEYLCSDDTLCREVRDAGKTKTALAHAERKRQPEEAGTPL